MSKNFNNKACHPEPTAVVYRHIHSNRNHVDLCLQGSSDLRLCGSQLDQNIAPILLFLDDPLMFFPALGVNFSFTLF